MPYGSCAKKAKKKKKKKKKKKLMKWLCDVYKCFSVTKSYFKQAECKCFTEIGIVYKGYINPELQDLAIQFFLQIFVRHAIHLKIVWLPWIFWIE